MTNRRRATTWLTICALITNLFTTPMAFAGKRWFQTSTTVDELAKSIDKLQRHIDQYGTIVAKTPDVWGESRLMRHRDDFEREMEKDLDAFRQVLSASQSTRDGAFLASALSLQQVLRGDDGRFEAIPTPEINIANMVPTADTLTQDTNFGFSRPSSNVIFKESIKNEAGQDTLSLSTEPEIYLDQKKNFLNHLNQIRRLNEGDDTADSPGYALNLVRVPVSILPGKRTRVGHGAEVNVTVEPVLGDDLLPETFRDFVINDVVNRIAPTVTHYVNNTNRQDKFQSAWQQYVNAIVAKKSVEYVKYNSDVASDQKRWPVAAIDQILINSETLKDNNVLKGIKMGAEKWAYNMTSPNEEETLENLVNYVETLKSGSPNNPTNSDHQKSQKIYDELIRGFRSGTHEFQFGSPASTDSDGASLPESDSDVSSLNGDRRSRHNKLILTSGTIPHSQSATTTALQKVLDQLDDALAKLTSTFPELRSELALSGVANRQADISLPATHADSVNGTSLITTCIAASKILNNSVDLDRPIHLTVVKTFLRDEVAAAYKFLSQPNATAIWQEHCTPELVAAVREHRRRHETNEWKDYIVKNPAAFADTGHPSLSELRKAFHDHISTWYPRADFSVTAHLAWHILVESALLNERLVEDMQSLASAKNAYNLCTYWQPYYGPNPPPEARAAFNDYVRCRWPIHVFALDPVTQDQNVGSSFSQRRELQLVLALAAANRMLTAQSLTRFVRRLEYDLETIELNRTAVGFSHGNSDFGWRFYPRVQTPRVPGNLSAITHDLLIGGQSRDSLQKDRMLEPGIRECTALVVMPSFVPYMMVDVRTNYFSLTCDKFKLRPALKRTMDVSDAVELSEEITQMRCLATKCVEDAHLYREGEVHRLMKVVKQLDSQLPLQTEFVQIPYENTAGGFEIFNSGVTDLAPELLDWYGAPHIVVNRELTPSPASAQTVRTPVEGNPDKVAITRPHPNLVDSEKPETAQYGTTLFLIGKNFTALGDGTRVIAGGADVTRTRKLISREVMQVTIPPDVATQEHTLYGATKASSYVDIHIATPYGVTRRLLVKAVDPAAVAAASTETSEAIKKLNEEVKKKVEASAVDQKIEKALADRNTGDQYDNFFWSQKKIKACVDLNDNATIKFLNLQEHTTIVDRTVPPQPWNEFDSKFSEFQAKIGVLAYVKGKSDTAYDIDPIKFVINDVKRKAGQDGQHLLHIAVPMRQPYPIQLIEKMKNQFLIEMSAAHKKVPMDLQAIKFELYVRIEKPDNRAGDVFKVKDDLLIEVSPCKSKETPPGDTPAPATAPAPATMGAGGQSSEASVPQESEEAPGPMLRTPAPQSPSGYLIPPSRVFQ